MLPDDYWFAGIQIANPYASTIIFPLYEQEPSFRAPINYDYTPGPQDWHYPKPAVMFSEPSWLVRLFPPGFPTHLLPLLLLPLFTALGKALVYFIFFLLKK